MENSDSLDILKTAILLERKGKAFYLHIANQAIDEDLKNFFLIMSEEEDVHEQQLTEQFNFFTKNKEFKKIDLPDIVNETNKLILSEKIKHKISAASFEAAAISAAIDFETNAVKIYSERAKKAVSPIEKQFYQWLANWEKGHYKLLFNLDKELKEKIWFDNKFWPF